MKKMTNVIASVAKQSVRIGCFVAALLATTALSAVAADKNWNAQGDQQDWFDSANWLPSGAPSAEDDAKVDFKDASVDIGQTFGARSLTVGGKKSSTVSVGNFVTGSLEPVNATDDSVVVRRQGKLILKGSTGKITVKGAYKDSEEIIPEEPSFMLYVK